MKRKTLLYDCFSGISGDMHIGALVDLGVPKDYLCTQLAKLSLADEFTLQLTNTLKMGIAGTFAKVVLHADTHGTPPLRHLADIEGIIDQAGYAPKVSEIARGIFTEIARAETKIHGTSVDKIHFHEVGATDSIVDIVAAGICIDYLNIDDFYCGTVQLGGGMVRCAHGLMPVPAPATAEILCDVPCGYGRVKGEATTPTGAAILKYTVSSFTPPPDFIAHKVAYGIGQSDFEIPNVLRVMLGETAGPASSKHYQHESAIMMECNIDDMSPEAFQPMIHGLFVLGAMDVSLTPILMKKSRPGQCISVLCTKGLQEQITDYLFANSSTLGLRTYAVDKFMLPREVRLIKTSFGEVHVKLVSLKSGLRRWKTEFDDIKRLAESHSMEYFHLKQLVDVEVSAAIARNSSESVRIDNDAG